MKTLGLHPFRGATIIAAVVAAMSGFAFAWSPPLEIPARTRQTYGFFGSVAGIPDVNGDGLGDVIVGASGLDNYRGFVYILDGCTGRGLSGFPSPNPTRDGYFGSRVAGISDVNGDGRGDLLVSGEGWIYILEGRWGGLLHTLSPPLSMRGLTRHFGWSPSGISDVNGDGREDVIIGSGGRISTEAPEDSGLAFIFDGSTGLMISTLASPNPEERGGFGSRVSGGPDVNGDGIGDIVVGASGELRGSGKYDNGAGRAYVFDGLTRELLHTLVSPAQGELGSFGSGVAGVDDLDGDGLGDVIVAASNEGDRPGFDEIGRVYVFSGATGELVHRLDPPDPDHVGTSGSVAGIPDVTGDGRGDVLVGQTGRIYLYGGASGTLTDWFLSPRELETGALSGSFWVPAAIPDANGDGIPDLIVGASTENGPAGEIASGNAYIFRLGRPKTIATMVESFYHIVLGRAPEHGAVDAWRTGYFDYAVAMNVDVRFVPREMGRLFFLSDEYTTRTRTDAQFITNCYWAFLDRDPQQAELDQWLGTGDRTATESGDRHVLARSSLRPSQSPVSWNRAEVVTIFAESEEFAARIVKMYPDNPGDPSRNFVTTMYIGLLDRLADSAGLEYAASLFDAAKGVGQPPSAVEFSRGNPGGGAGATRIRNSIEACRTQAKQTAREILASDEFQNLINSAIPNPHSAIVARLYRAFLGRFPADHERAYWTGELDAGRTTTDAMIDQFAAAPEFTARLEQYFGG